jgi:hypothetical protein
MNYNDFANQTASQKIILSTIECKEMLKLFDVNGGVYERQAKFFVLKVEYNGNQLDLDNTLQLNTFYYDVKTGLLSVNVGENPKLGTLYVTYRLFFSNVPVNIPWDFAGGDVVHYDSLLRSIGGLKFELDFEQTGIALESDSSITLENSDGFFDSIFDTLIFENQSVKFYSWSLDLAVSEAKLIYSGLIKDKSFTQNEVRFNLKDAIYQLRRPVNLPLFSESDGTLSPSDIGKPKNRIYGRVNQVRSTGIDKVLGGYPLSQPVNGSVGSDTITGDNFLVEVSPQDRLIFNVAGIDFDVTVDEVIDDNTLKISSELELGLVNAQARVNPSIPYRFKNRLWHFAGHLLFNYSALVTEVITANRIRVNNTTSLRIGDSITIGAQRRVISRISSDVIITSQVFSPAPVVNDIVAKLPVFEVFFNENRLIPTRDYLIINDGNARIQVGQLAEFNIARVVTNNVNLTFTNGSRSVTTAADIDLKTILQSRDWIISNDINHAVWYEVLAVNEKDLTLRVAYTGSNFTGASRRKNVDYINDDSLITVSTIGLERGGEYIDTCAKIVKDLLTNDADLNDLDNDLFNEASIDCSYMPALVLDKKTLIRDAIGLVNNSCFGSLFQTNDFKFGYKILNADKDDEIEMLKDDDIISWQSQTTNNILGKVTVNYSPFVDRFNGQDSFRSVEFTSEFVEKTSNIKEEKEQTVFLYNESSASVIAQRLAFFNSLSQGVVTIRSKLNLSLLALNDQLRLSFRRLFNRFGSNDRVRIGIVNSITKDGANTIVRVNDLSGVYTRVKSIADNDVSDFDKNGQFEIYGYIIDDETLTPDPASEQDLGNNLIG